MRKYSYFLSVLFVGIGVVSISAPSQARIVNTIQTNGEAARDIQREAEQDARRGLAEQKALTAMNLAVSAIDACYTDKNLEECNKANRIKNTLMNWCIQSNNAKSNACDAHRFILGYENAKQAIQTVEQTGY